MTSDRRPDADATQEVAAVRAGADPQPGTSPQAQAHAAAVQDDVARADVRRAEEATSSAQQQAEEAQKAEDAAERAEAEARDKERRAREEAEAARRRAEEAARSGSATQDPSIAAVPVSGAVPPGGQPIVFGPFTAEKPELLVVAAFVGAFLLGRILKKITD